MKGPVFPWRSGNRFALLCDGENFFPRMLDCIAAAECKVELELYLVEGGSCAEALLTALLEACQRGVKVRCLFDGFGSLKLGSGWSRKLVEAGGEFRHYNPLRWRSGMRNLFRDHRKLLLVDQRLAYVGGTGATDEFWSARDNSSSWHEVMVEMSGPVVADWQSLFERQWQACLEQKAWRPKDGMLLTRLPPFPSSGSGLGRVAYADASQHRDILQSLIRALRGARQRVWLATPYFLPSWKVRRALRKAAQRGVEVRLLLTGRLTDHAPVRYAGQRYYPRLLRAGIRIYEYQPRFLHLKMVLVDDWTSVGSCNFDHWNLRFNLEANLEAHDAEFTAAVEQCLAADFAQSQEIDLETWRARPWWKRLRQRLWGALDRLVVNFLDRRR
ncbi:phospholipase D-like domain-containing protein [Pseudomonas schmalbachii]|uniref:Phosphatidylserine/phosphatidylglycerophosphate/ cardiolipin synthase family protein n=1 Tax=Pseudomonas schmalbachii TaxID=2816993 RepID=A0ABS3TMV7_9PSED|nr:phosphatidylserine/phosphatidylglycerophosphate/cardiolipin synthase family protein [Pseudomonas schmalbachii]MBO3274982.1 phosphatidylserine/phosphatidylglycerophosphate/cardiolipin synthase family protein [Pseudomonas schmalbachii]